MNELAKTSRDESIGTRGEHARPLDAQTPAGKGGRKSSVLTRFWAGLVLLGLTTGLLLLGRTAYWAMTDSYIAPMSLSADNDLVLTNKARLIQLEAERTRARTQLEVIESELAAFEVERSRLTTLKERAAGALPWTESVTSMEASAGSAAITALERARSLLIEMIDRQSKLLDGARTNLKLGVISKTDLEKEEQTLNQLRLALLENDRDRAQSDFLNKKTHLSQQSLTRTHGSAAMPELLANEGALVRLDLEILHLDGQRRIKLGEKRVLTETLERLDDLASQLKGRPLFQAIERDLDVAFVPYTQLPGVEAGARVFDCALGVFACEDVGSVAEVVPGEVILPDPWGKQARGQYLVLTLRDRDAVRASTLRVRDPGPTALPPTRHREEPEHVLSASERGSVGTSEE